MKNSNIGFIIGAILIGAALIISASILSNVIHDLNEIIQRGLVDLTNVLK